MMVGVCLLAGLTLSTAAHAGPSGRCTSSQSAAVQCFVANAVATNMTAPRYGMTLAQFQDYGVAVSTILQTHHTYLSLVGISSAIADAMPPTNANGSANQAAQDLAVEQIVNAAVTSGLASAPSGVTQQDLEWFSLDLVNAMNNNNGYISLMTPGVSLRIVDSYIVTATSNGSVNWTQANQGISNAVDSFIQAGLIKIPSGLSSTNVKSFLQATAQTIYSYKVSTGRTTL